MLGAIGRWRQGVPHRGRSLEPTGIAPINSGTRCRGPGRETAVERNALVLLKEPIVLIVRHREFTFLAGVREAMLP